MRTNRRSVQRTNMFCNKHKDYDIRYRLVQFAWMGAPNREYNFFVNRCYRNSEANDREEEREKKRLCSECVASLKILSRGDVWSHFILSTCTRNFTCIFMVMTHRYEHLVVQNLQFFFLTCNFHNGFTRKTKRFVMNAASCIFIFEQSAPYLGVSVVYSDIHLNRSNNSSEFIHWIPTKARCTPNNRN